MKLMCIKPYVAHWGSILTSGKEYEFGEKKLKKVQIHTDDEMYYKLIRELVHMGKEIRLKNLDELSDELKDSFQMLNKETDKYVTYIDIDVIETISDDNMSEYFYTQTPSQIIKKYELTDKCLNKSGDISFGHTMHSIDEYFDYSHIRRLEKLNNIL